MLHRNYYSNGNVKEEYHYDEQQQYQSLDGPAYTRYYDTGIICYQKWCTGGLRYRADGPADISYFENGRVMEERWYRYDQLNRKDKPAVIQYDEHGHIWRQFYYENGILIKEEILN
jgi:antitoxin component YwqK of YwqJK toxin-antitoxin module